MLGYAIRRLFWIVPIMFVSSVLVFAAIQATTDPGVIVGAGVRAEDMQRLRADLGLDASPITQYWKWLINFVQGDLGDSLQTNQPVWPELWEALRNSVYLGAIAFAVAVAAAVVIGTVSALKHNSVVDHAATGTSFLFLSIPQFLFGLVLLIVVGIYLKDTWISDQLILTNGTRFDMWSLDRARAVVLPAITVAVQVIAVYSRYMRSSMLDALNADYLRTARAKGVRERRVVVRHAMRNALIPLVTVGAIDVGAILSGLIITEQVFEWRGMGFYFLNAFGEGDYFRVLPWAMIVVASVVIFNLVADLLYGALDPRIRYD